MKSLLTLLVAFVLHLGVAAQTQTIHVKKGSCNCSFVVKADSSLINKTLRLEYFSIKGIPDRKINYMRSQINWIHRSQKTISQTSFEQEFSNSLCLEEKYILKIIRIAASSGDNTQFHALFEFKERPHTYK
jgi:hypothetical protein